MGSIIKGEEMKRNILFVIVLLLVTASVAYADSRLPEDTQEFYNSYGHVCYVWPDGSGDCYCRCPEGKGHSAERILPPTDWFAPTDTPEPTDISEPTPEFTEQPKRKPGWGYGDKNHCHDGPRGPKGR